MCLSTSINMAIPFCSFSGMGGTPPSVSGRQPNSYARGRSTATTSTHQVSYLVNTKLINYLTVFLPFSVLQMMSLYLQLVVLQIYVIILFQLLKGCSVLFVIFTISLLKYALLYDFAHYVYFFLQWICTLSMLFC